MLARHSQASWDLLDSSEVLGGEVSETSDPGATTNMFQWHPGSRHDNKYGTQPGASQRWYTWHLEYPEVGDGYQTHRIGLQSAGPHIMDSLD